MTDKDLRQEAAKTDRCRLVGFDLGRFSEGIKWAFTGDLVGGLGGEF